ncbi:uncharacterized protein JCM6883_006135 [Sporobolomyces salmoneus]|uniref:uncharacterized protein n=1 Tax=Sporobolomyces salmoneus TaxID=183962 RepID=UPI00316FB752
MAVPKYRSALSNRLPAAKLPLFRSVVSHPPSPFAVQANTNAKERANDPKGKGKAKVTAAHPLVGAHSIFYSTSPRPLIPLTSSPANHKLWNPPAPDSTQSRSIEKDESGRLAKFSSRFGGASNEESEQAAKSNKKPEEALFGVEGDLSWLEGTTLQSPGGAPGKRDIVGPQKKEKKGKK